ncbi:hypothetical protein LNP24_22260 [Klebsiella pneumoniae subsp. pneumoniae]|nr:hypothetical protein [Klebsiella pneumoniae subsp. pneumoniae]
MHDSLTIALLQAREAAMAYFRPIVKRHNLTGTAVADRANSRRTSVDGLSRSGLSRLYPAPQSDRYF